MKELIELLKANGGEILSTSSLSVEDINQARASERMYVDADGFGFVWVPPLDRFPETEEEVENFEKWFPLEMEVPKYLQKLPEKLSSLQSKGKTKEEVKLKEVLRDAFGYYSQIGETDMSQKDVDDDFEEWYKEAMEEYGQSRANQDGFKEICLPDFLTTENGRIYFSSWSDGEESLFEVTPQLTDWLTKHGLKITP